MPEKIRISSNSVITILILLYFIIRTHGVAGYLPSVWAIPLLLIFAFSILVLPKLPNKSLSQLVKESRWIILSLIVLIVCMFLQYGNFKLYSTFNYLVFSIPFYIIGYFWGIFGRDKYFKISVIGYFIFISLFLFSKLLQVDNFGTIGKETIGRLFYTPGGEANYNEIIFFWPYVAFVLITAISLLSRKYLIPKNRTFLYVLSSICLISILFSGVAAPIVLIVIAMLVYYFNKSKSKGRIRLLLAIPGILLFSYLIIYLLGSGLVGNFGTATSKAEGFLLFFESGYIFDDFILNEITSGRWTAGMYSINQFLAAPLTGHGAFLEDIKGAMTNIDNFNTAAGGHSFVLDSLAFYGIWGISLIMILIKFSTDAIKYYKIAGPDEKKMALIFASAIISLFISNIMNSTFLFSSFDQFVFLCCGFLLGKYHIAKNSEKLNLA